MATLSRRHVLAIVAAGLAGCSAPTPRARLAELTYAHRGAFRLDVARIDIRSDYRPRLAPPDVEHLFPLTPEQAMRRWAQDRLAATGTGARRATFIIKDARVIETRLPPTPGLRGMFTRDQSERYDAVLEATIEIRNAATNLVEADASARSFNTRTVSESISVNDREAIWYALVEQAMVALDAELERRIRESFTAVLR